MQKKPLSKIAILELRSEMWYILFFFISTKPEAAGATKYPLSLFNFDKILLNGY